jgi:hypothetical protein
MLMIGKLVLRTVALAAVAVCAAGSALGSAVTVDSVEALNPNPYAIPTVDAASNTAGPNGITLAAFQTLMQGPSGAYRANRGGVLNFEQQFQGGSWPNAIASSNGIDVGNGAANLVTARYGLGLASNLQFYRTSTGTDAIDSNTNNILAGVTSTVSGSGGGTLNPGQNNAGGVAKYNFTTQAYDPTAPDVGGAYMGVVGGAALELNFLTGLQAFGITGLPRGATRHTQLTFTLSDSTTFTSSNEVVGTSAVFFGGQVTPAQAALGLTITKVAFAHPDGVNRYDDLAFVVPVPEPSCMGLMGTACLVIMLRRRRG